tara:strand:- start:394 stop:840 length:447 start_codon:yes stop_codon:yes gene_type:complete
MKKLTVLILLALFTINTGFVDMISDCVSEGETFYSLSEALKNPEEVKKLDISMNKLKIIPGDIGKLTNLECLDLSFNTFSTLPKELVLLKKLKYLNIAGTRYMPKIPDVVFKIKSLEILDIQDHPEWNKAIFDDAVAKLPKVKVILLE